MRRLVPHAWLESLAERCVPPSVVLRSGPRRGRRVALTFDDGPCALTHAYLDLLARHAARATFFVVGAECEGRRELLAEIVRRGHALGAHGYSHTPFPALARTGALAAELSRTQALLPETVAARRWLRPPYGEWSLRSVLVCLRARATLVFWSVDSGDWRLEDPHEIAERVGPNRVRPGAIVLMHEGQTHTLEALGEILPRLERSGYELVTLPELVAA